VVTIDANRREEALPGDDIEILTTSPRETGDDPRVEYRDDHAQRTPEELALHWLRMSAIGIIAAAVAFNGFKGPLLRWRLFRARIITRLDPLDTQSSMIIATVVDLLSSLDSAGTKQTR
jgi:hypothetical protein